MTRSPSARTTVHSGRAVKAVASFACVLLSGHVTHAFAPPLHRPSAVPFDALSNGRYARVRLYGLPKEYRPEEGDGDGHNEKNDSDRDAAAFDLESERTRLESLFGGGASSSENAADDDGVDDGGSDTEHDSDTEFVRNLIDPLSPIDLPPQPPLTSIERDRRLAEIQCLRQLRNGDDATGDLWQLWFFERGPRAREQLQRADELMSSGNPLMWAQCEGILTDLVKEYGVYWVEPLNRLATLYFVQGRFEQSYKLCQIVLQIKPWHFGALSGIVMVCIKLNDRDQARTWASRRLPSMVSSTSFPPFEEKEGPVNPRRAEWVDRAVDDAEAALRRAERLTKRSFGEPEDYYEPHNPLLKKVPKKETDATVFDQADGDAWQ